MAEARHNTGTGIVPTRRTSSRARFGLVLELFARCVRRDLLVVKVSGESMLPTLRPADLVLCSRTAPRYLHAIVLDEQAYSKEHVARNVKRITGLAGDVRDYTRIAPGFVWVEGDNRDASSDSRQWGPIPLERLGAVALAILRSGQLIDVRASARGTTREPRKEVMESWRDWSRRISTRGMVRPDAFGFSPSSVHAYTPTPWEVAHRALDSIDISADDTFVDYGCGRGRMLYVALQYPFRRVIGIELLPTLAATARSNLARYGERCTIIEVDASTYPLPDEASVVYIFNAFGRDVLPVVFRRVRESLARRPRRLQLLTYGIEPTILTPFITEPPIAIESRLVLYLLGDVQRT